MQNEVEHPDKRTSGAASRLIVSVARGGAGAILSYALVVALVGAVLFDLSATGVRSVTALIDTAIAESVDELRQATAGQPEISAGTQKERAFRLQADAADTTAFPHARPAPRFVERRDSTAIEQLKQGVVERVVADDPTPWLAEDVRTYRTMCVRLCDGAYFPISFATTRNRFAEDEARCAARCGSPTRLFAFPNDGGSPDVMKDRSGRSYIALPTAFQFRKGSDAACTCRAAPWEEASKARHRRYAMEAVRGDGDLTVTASLPATGELATDAEKSAAGEPETPAAGPTTNTSPDDQSKSMTTASLAHGTASPDARDLAAPTGVSGPEQKASDVDHANGSRPQGEVEDQASDVLASRANGTTSKKAARQRRPVIATAAPAVAGVTASAQPVTAPGRIPPSVTRLYADKPIWGVGRNAHSSPRGGSAAETFARNFY